MADGADERGCRAHRPACVWGVCRVVRALVPACPCVFWCVCVCLSTCVYGRDFWSVCVCMCVCRCVGVHRLRLRVLLCVVLGEKQRKRSKHFGVPISAVEVMHCP